MKKLFTNDGFFLTATVLAVFCCFIYACGGVIFWEGHVADMFTLIMRLACIVALYFSYVKHSKNVMKGMMGALLMGQVMSAVNYVESSTTTTSLIFTLIYAALSAVLFVNHFVINSDHHSKPANIYLNIVLVILLVINNLIWEIYLIGQFTSVVSVVFAVIDIIGFAFMVSIVVCVETRLDAYRIKREAEGWTEDK